MLLCEVEQRFLDRGLETIRKAQNAFVFLLGVDPDGGEIRTHLIAQHPLDQRAVAHVTDYQRCVTHGLPEAGVQIVERHDALPTHLQLQQDMAADVAGAAGDQDGFLRHCE